MKGILALLLVLPLNVFAAGLTDLQVKELSKYAMSEYKAYNTGSLINVKYVGAEVSSEINITSATLNLEAPVDTVIATFDMTYAAYNTLGELCDAINAQTGFVCTLTGGKRDDSSILTWDAVTAQSLSGATGYDVLIGTGAVVGETGAYTMRVGITPSSGKAVVLKYCTANVNSSTADANALNVYGKLAKYASSTNNDTTQVIGGVRFLDDTSTSAGDTNGGYWLEFAKDAHVVVSAGSGTSTQVAGNFLTCYWDEK